MEQDREGAIPRYDLGSWTVVHDVESQNTIMQLNGTVVLPVGATIELVRPDRTARVVGVRLLAPKELSTNPLDKAVYVCLDVQVDEA